MRKRGKEEDIERKRDREVMKEAKKGGGDKEGQGDRDRQ